MRDIRPDLKDRINNIPKRKQELEREIQSLSDEEKQLKTLLELEDRRYTVSKSSVSVGNDSRTLSDIVYEDIIADGKPHSLEEIKESLKGNPLLAGVSSPGRAIHFALVGLLKKDLAEREANDDWRMKGPKRKMG